ncbi:MAG: transposase family protein, partial [Phycisphaerales bacterium]|nr:transposase family protein [Phycisphaerales bacterium]
MDAQATTRIPRAFETMPDPRRHNVRHPFLDIITIAFFAVLCGCDDWCSVASYGRTKHAWLATFLK